MKRIGLLPVAFAAMVAVACGGNGRDTGTTTGGEAVGTAGEETVDRGTRQFVEEMTAGNMAEVELGRLASARAQTTEVKQFASTLVEDHNKALDELKQIATQHRLQPPAELNEDARELRDRLSKLQGAEFDREFIQAMIDKHEQTIDKLEGRVDMENDMPRAKEADNPAEMQVNQWAAKTQPVVRQHLERARQIDQTLGRRTTYDNPR